MTKGILLIGNFPPPYGGVPSHLAYLAPHLARRGWDVQVLSLKYRATEVENHDGFVVHSPGRRSRAEKARLVARHFAKVWNGRGFAWQDSWELYRCLDLFDIAIRIARKRRIDVVSSYHFLPAGLVGAWLSRAFDVPLVTTIFGDVYDQPEYHQRRLREVRDVLRRSRRLLSCSRHCARSIEQLRLSRPIDVVYYGVDTTRFNPGNDGGAVRRKLGIDPNNPVVLFVGRMTEGMGLQVLLAAIPTILHTQPATRFIICGREGNLLPIARQHAAAAPDRVLVLPNLPDAELPALYAAATVAVVPSLTARACLGLAIIEAMATARPVVASSAGGGPEVVLDGDTGILVPAGDARALAAQVVQLLANEELRRRLGTSGRARVEALFSKDAANRHMEQVFTEVAR